MRFHLLHPRDQLVTIMHRIYNNGMTTLSGGNLSTREENGDIWITPTGTDKGKLQPSDIVLMRANGSAQGVHRPSSEYPFHQAIYEQRPDLRAVVHAHSPALVAFSIARQIPDTSIIPQAQEVCGAVGWAPYGVPGTSELGDTIARAFGKGHNLVLPENHGVAAGGSDLLLAFHRLETLDFCARTLLHAQGLKPISTLSAGQLKLLGSKRNYLPEFVPAEHSSRERALRQQVVEAVRRAVDRYLMMSTEGVVSARVDEHSFLITPTGMDRGSMELQDIVLIRDGHREQGKLPSRSVCMHSAIYDTHADIHCVITAQPPYATAFAISAKPFDTRTIPESYVMLRDIQTFPYGAQFRDPQRVADAVALDRPVLLLQNDALVTVGGTVLQALDRLEVAEFSAKSLVDAQALGEVSPLGEHQIDHLRKRFGLD